MVIRWCLMLMTLVHQPVNSQRLVVNTTCLKLAKSSNQQLRLSCDNPDNYHCLIDGSNTREYEVCRVWKWISKDTACYVKRNTNTDGHMETSSSSPVTDSDNSTSSDWENIDRTPQRDMYIHFKCLHHSKDDIERKSAEKDAASPKEQVPLLSDENQGQTKESNPATQFQNCNESKQNDANMLKLKKSEEDTSGHSELSGNAQMDEWSIEKSEEKTNNDSDSGDEEEFYESLESPLTTPVGSPMILDSRGEQGSLIEPNSQTEQTGNYVKGEEEYSNENDLHNDYTSDYESTEVFDDTIESLQKSQLK
uniref:Uncharacterized protein LOC111135368 isoform X2 n=1 Tax=Crassostrea virginica TaxID=6565 RepID=A0A8B8EMH0_CRAVI|nr:uncharacterized protein LOC111135368 isoform X2 [Crassostrea virginica]